MPFLLARKGLLASSPAVVVLPAWKCERPETGCSGHPPSLHSVQRQLVQVTVWAFLRAYVRAVIDRSKMEPFPKKQKTGPVRKAGAEPKEEGAVGKEEGAAGVEDEAQLIVVGLESHTD